MVPAGGLIGKTKLTGSLKEPPLQLRNNYKSNKILFAIKFAEQLFSKSVCIRKNKKSLIFTLKFPGAAILNNCDKLRQPRSQGLSREPENEFGVTVALLI